MLLEWFWFIHMKLLKTIFYANKFGKLYNNIGISIQIKKD